MQPAGVGAEAVPGPPSGSEELPADVQSRLVEAEQTAQANAGRVRTALAPRWPQLQARLRAIVQGCGPRRARIVALVKVADIREFFPHDTAHE